MMIDRMLRLYIRAFGYKWMIQWWPWSIKGYWHDAEERYRVWPFCVFRYGTKEPRRYAMFE